MNMPGRKLLVLMWKHGTVRIRRFIHTPLEFLSPILIFVLLFCFRPQAPPASVRASQHQIKHTDIMDLTRLPAPYRILYTPDTNLTRALMDEAGPALKLKRLERFPDHLFKGYYAFTNLSEIASFVSELDNKEAILQFENLDGDSWPNRLTYTIRMKNAFFTNTYEAFDHMQRPHSQFATVYEEVMRLQYAIDKSYIKLLTNNEINQRVSLQEFPYYGPGNNDTVSLLCMFLTFLCWLSLFLVFVFQMARLIEERATGIQELIKMVGVSSSTLGISHFLNVLPAGLTFSIVNTILLKVSSNPLLPNSNGVLIFLVLALTFVSVIAFAFAFSYVAKSPQYTVSIALLVYVVMLVPSQALDNHTLPRAFVFLTGLLPFVPLQWMWKEIGALEYYGYGLTFSEACKHHSDKSESVLFSIIFLIIQSLLFFMISWYLSLVRPGNYGQALPWNFMFQKQYWSQNEVQPESESDEEAPIVTERKYFEAPPKHLETGIKIENVSKIFPTQTALSNVSLEVYKGEITVLLGHNGAGKTTLMSIITGMISATEGKVYVNGMDAVIQKDAVRQHIGLCPQHNLFFPDLTVLEHVMFFTLLKRGSYSEAQQSSLELLSSLGLRDKANVNSKALSGGMKRRLQLACALAGGASVLVLDEPTSGLDVETRRQLWDLLLSLRGDRTVLLTTHFMEEADALGDRVAALHSGQLRCHATTMYLKKAIGTGYRLTFTTNGPPRDAAVTDAVTSYVPDATLKEKTINSLSYNLPASASGKFSQLFTALEERKMQLNIETIGVGVSTLEEVFLKLCSDTDNTYSEDEVDTTRSEPTYNKVTGFPLYVRQFCLLFKRQCKFVQSRKLSFFMLQLIMPVAMIFFFTNAYNNVNDSPYSNMNQKLRLDLDLYTPMQEKKVLEDVNVTGISLSTLYDRYPTVDFQKTNNVAEAMLGAAKKDVIDYNKYIIGIEINDTDIKVLFTTTVRHAAPVAMNLLTNALATQFLPGADGPTFTTYIHPVQKEDAVAFDEGIVEPKSLTMALVWCLLVVFVVLVGVMQNVPLPCKERATGSRHIHIMSGCPASLYWAATCCFHALVTFAFYVLATAVAAATLDEDKTIDKPEVILTLMLILTLGALAFLSFMYIVSFYFSERITTVIIVACLIVFGLITTTTKGLSDMVRDPESFSILDVLITAVSYTMPPHTLTFAVGKCVQVARLNAFCVLNKARCPDLVVLEQGFDTDKCCSGENPRCYMCFDKYSPLKEICILAAQFIVYMTLVVLTERGTFNSIYDRIFNTKYRNQASRDTRADDMARAEATYVDKAIELPKQQIEESRLAMLVSGLHKNYPAIFGKPCNAVKGVSFSLKQGECFGLLGVNGAGKSTTFKMLTAEECPTKGNIYANGYHLQESQQYLRSLGYCPQFFGLDAFLTGRENLKLVLTLRGLDAADVSAAAKSWIQVVGLEKYSDRAVSGYSGGCMRRLAAAAALSAGAPITLLDEPTSGVDVAARRRVWSALKRGLRQGRAVIITSHSMDEMEALCSRIAIMSNGRIRALGTPSELRAHHAAGHAVVIKVSSSRSGDEVDGVISVEQLKRSLNQKFNCTLKDEHKTMLHYHINETLRYSNLFTALEELKDQFPYLVEDYSVTETTLEEVFLSFAKEQQLEQEQEEEERTTRRRTGRENGREANGVV